MGCKRLQITAFMSPPFMIIKLKLQIIISLNSFNIISTHPLAPSLSQREREMPGGHPPLFLKRGGPRRVVTVWGDGKIQKM